MSSALVEKLCKLLSFWVGFPSKGQKWGIKEHDMTWWSICMGTVIKYGGWGKKLKLQISHIILRIYRATDTPILDFWWYLPWAQSQGRSLPCMEWIPQFQLWCDTCRPLDGQHGSWAFLIHILGTSIALTPTLKQCSEQNENFSAVFFSEHLEQKTSKFFELHISL